jgi:fatty acid desaturase
VNLHHLQTALNWYLLAKVTKLLKIKYYNFNIFVTVAASTRLRISEDDVDASNHVGLITKYF